MQSKKKVTKLYLQIMLVKFLTLNMSNIILIQNRLGGWECSSVVEHWPHMHSLGLDLSTEKPETDRHIRISRMHVIILGLYGN